MNSSSRIRRSPSAAKPELAVHLARQPHARRPARRANTTSTASSQNGLCAEEVDAERREHHVEDDQVGDGPAAQAHTVISYLSKRR